MSENLLQNKKIFLVGLLFIALIGGMSIDNFVGNIESATSEGEAIEQIIEKINVLEEKVVFTGYLIKEHENIFYIKPSTWNSLTEEEKQTTLMSASKIVIYDKMLNLNFKTLREEQIKTKIYSSLNHEELLGHVSINSIINKKGKIKRNKKFSDAYKFTEANEAYHGQENIEIDAVIDTQESEETENYE